MTGFLPSKERSISTTIPWLYSHHCQQLPLLEINMNYKTPAAGLNNASILFWKHGPLNHQLCHLTLWAWDSSWSFFMPKIKGLNMEFYNFGKLAFSLCLSQNWQLLPAIFQLSFSLALLCLHSMYRRACSHRLTISNTLHGQRNNVKIDT